VDKVVSFRPLAGRAFTITGSDNDIGVVGEIERSGGQYQRELTPFLQRVLPRDAVVVDGGAHIGVLTTLFASLCPAGHVYSFEPTDESHAYLVQNVEANELTNVTVEKVALYDADTEVALDANAAQPGGAHITTAGATVPATSIDSWAARAGLRRFDLFKLDVEGAEITVLSAAARTLRRFGTTAIVECNPVALRRFGNTSYRDLFATMQSLFPVVAIVDHGGATVPLRSARHLELVLGERGVVDLVGLPRRALVRERAVAIARSVANQADLSRRYNRWRPAENKVVDATLSITPQVADITGAPATTVTVPVRIENRTRWWLSSSFPYHPVHVSYRLRDATGALVVPEGHRTRFPAPLRPGAAADVDVLVELPSGAGGYECEITLVQEAFAWLDDLDPSCAARLPARAH
jgi:FkbM family methyltransferase